VLDPVPDLHRLARHGPPELFEPPDLLGEPGRDRLGARVDALAIDADPAPLPSGLPAEELAVIPLADDNHAGGRAGCLRLSANRRQLVGCQRPLAAQPARSGRKNFLKVAGQLAQWTFRVLDKSGRRSSLELSETAQELEDGQGGRRRIVDALLSWAAMDVLAARAEGTYDYDDAQRQATVVSVLPLRFRNAHEAGLRLDASLGFALGTLSDTSLSGDDRTIQDRMEFVAEVSVAFATGPWLQATSVTRSVVPTGDFLLLAEERVKASLTRERWRSSTTIHGTAARAAAISESGRGDSELIGGGRLEQQLALSGGLGAVAELSLMRSFYPDRGERSAVPRLAAEARIGLAYSWERPSTHRRRTRSLTSF
jgi:hypothetical protein